MGGLIPYSIIKRGGITTVPPHLFVYKYKENSVKLRVIHILAIEGHDVVEHALGLDSRTVRVELNGLNVAVDGFVPLRLLPVFVAFQIILFCGHS